MKYSIFYPETGERFPGAPEFDTPLEAVVFWNDKRPDWQRLQSQGEDKATFINPRTGAIIVIRAVSGEAQS